MPDQDPMRIKNVDSKDFTFQYKNRWYSIEPQKEIIMPEDACMSLFGNWTCRDNPDNPQAQQPRGEEWQRINTRYGVYFEPERHEQFPKVELYAITGDRVFTVIDDPRGERMIKEVPTMDQMEVLKAHAARMENQLRAVEEQMRQMQTASPPSDIPEDKPTRTKVSG